MPAEARVPQKMTHSITTRQLSDSERRDLWRREPDSFLVGALGCSGGYFVAFLIVIALARIAESFGLRAWGAPAFFWILSLIPAAAGLAILATILRRRAAARKARNREMDTGEVQMLRVEGARVLVHEAHNDEGPIYYFDIGDRKVLCLRGQWMLDLDHGRTDEQSLDPHDDSAPLPSSSFTVHRLPAGGDVLTIEAIGEGLAPEGVLSLDAALPSWMAPVRRNWLADSLLLDGDFDELVALCRRGS